MFEAKHTTRRIGIEKIRVSQSLHRCRVGLAAAGRNQQAVQHRVSDDRRGTYHVRLIRR
jgi:hypothetical protein